MQVKKLGKQTWEIANSVKIIGCGSIAGTLEGRGPLNHGFDKILEDDFNGESTWEKAESKLQSDAINAALINADVKISEIDMMLAGDLLNQCMGSTFAVRDIDIPYLGLYGACSTFAEALLIGTMAIDGGFATNVICGTSSHFGASERQFRFPMEYGGKRPPTAQWTVTGAGMAVLSSGGSGPSITHITPGKAIDPKIVDANNMGAAMAPAFVDTLKAHFNDTGFEPGSYDMILSGDLGLLGREIACDLANDEGICLNKNYQDCGMMVFDLDRQDVGCGGSGCGCSAIVFSGYIMNELKKKNIKNLLLVGTGALLSPTSVQQGESIPSVAHAVAISG